MQLGLHGGIEKKLLRNILLHMLPPRRYTIAASGQIPASSLVPDG